MGEQLDRLAYGAARGRANAALEAHDTYGSTLFQLGEYAAARTYLEQGTALIDPAAQRTQAERYGWAPGVRCLVYAANALWCLGFPVLAVLRSQGGASPGPRARASP